MSTTVANTVSFAHEIIQPTAVDHCFCAKFTSEVDNNLIIIKGDVLEIYTVSVPAALPSLSSIPAENQTHLPSIAKILDAQQRDPSLAQSSDILNLVYSTKLFGAVEAIDVLQFSHQRTASFALAFLDARVSVIHWDAHAHSICTVFAHDASDVNYQYEGADSSRCSPPSLAVMDEHRLLAVAALETRIFLYRHDNRCDHALFAPTRYHFHSGHLEGLAGVSAAPAPRLAHLSPAQVAAEAITLAQAEGAVSPFGSSGARSADKGRAPLFSSATGEAADGALALSYVGSVDVAAMVGAVRVRQVLPVPGAIAPTLLLLVETQRTWEGRYAAARNTCALVALALSLPVDGHVGVTANVVARADHLPHDCIRVLPVPTPLQGALVLAANAVFHFNGHFLDYCLAVNDNGDPGDLYRAVRMQPFPSPLGQSGVSLNRATACLLNMYRLEHRALSDALCRDAVSGAWMHPFEGTGRELLLEYLVCLQDGQWALMSVHAHAASVRRITLQPLSEGIVASAVTPVAPGLVFVGSRLCDSLLVQHERILPTAPTAQPQHSAAEVAKVEEAPSVATAALDEDDIFGFGGKTETPTADEYGAAADFATLRAAVKAEELVKEEAAAAAAAAAPAAAAAAEELDELELLLGGDAPGAAAGSGAGDAAPKSEGAGESLSAVDAADAAELEDIFQTGEREVVLQVAVHAETSELYRLLVRATLTTLAPLVGVVPTTTPEGRVRVYGACGFERGGRVVSVSDCVEPVGVHEDILDDAVLGAWAVTADAPVAVAAANAQTLSFRLPSYALDCGLAAGEYSATTRPLLALAALKRDLRRLARKAKGQTPADLNALLATDSKAVLGLCAFEAALAASDAARATAVPPAEVPQSGTAPQPNTALQRPAASAHRASMVVLSTAERTLALEAGDAAATELEPHLHTLLHRTEGDTSVARPASADQLALLLKLMRVGLLRDISAQTGLALTAPTLACGSALGGLGAMVQVTPGGFRLLDAGAGVLCEFELAQEDLGAAVAAGADGPPVVVQAAVCDPFVSMLTSDGRVLVAELNGSPAEPHWYHIRDLTHAVPAGPLLAPSPVSCVALAQLDLATLCPRFAAALALTPRQALALATTALEAGRFLLDQRTLPVTREDSDAQGPAHPASALAPVADDLEAMFAGEAADTAAAELAAPVPVSITAAAAMASTSVPASLPPAHVLLVAHTDRVDMLLLPRGVLLFSAHTPAAARSLLRNVLDDALAASPALTLKDNKLVDYSSAPADTPVTAPARAEGGEAAVVLGDLVPNASSNANNTPDAASVALPAPPSAPFVTHMHVAALERGAQPLLVAATDAGDMFAYRLFECLSPLALTSLAHACMHAPTAPLYHTLLAAHRSDPAATQLAAAADLLRAVLPPALPLRMRLLPLSLSVRAAAAEKHALDAVVESLRARLADLCSRLVGSTQPRKRSRKARGRHGRPSHQQGDEADAVAVESLSAAEEREVAGKLRLYAQLVGQRAVSLADFAAAGAVLPALPDWATHTAPTQPTLFSLSLLRPRSPFALSPLQLPPIPTRIAPAPLPGFPGLLLLGAQPTLLTSRMGAPVAMPLLPARPHSEDGSAASHPLAMCVLPLPLSRTSLLVSADVSSQLIVAMLPPTLPPAVSARLGAYSFTPTSQTFAYNRFAHTIAAARSRLAAMPLSAPAPALLDLAAAVHPALALAPRLAQASGAAPSAIATAAPMTAPMPVATSTASADMDDLDALFAADTPAPAPAAQPVVAATPTASTTTSSLLSPLAERWAALADAALMVAAPPLALSALGGAAETQPALMPLPLPTSSADAVVLVGGAAARVVPVGATPTKLALHETTNTLAVSLTSRVAGFALEEITPLSVPVYAQQPRVVFLSLPALTEAARYDELEAEEAITALQPAYLSGQWCICVGLATHNGPDTACKGRIIVLDPHYAQGVTHEGYAHSFLKLRAIVHKDKFPVFSLACIDNMLAVGSGSRVFLQELDRNKGSLVGRAFFPCQLACTDIQVVKNLLVVSDIYQSVTVLIWDALTRGLTLLARHHARLEPTATAVYLHGASCSFLVADAQGNTQLLYYHPRRMSSLKYQRLAARADYHVGSPVCALGVVLAPSYARIADQRRTQLASLLASTPIGLDPVPGGLDASTSSSASLCDAVLATRVAPAALSQSPRDNALSAPSLHPVRTCVLSATRAGSLVALLPADPHAQARLAQLFSLLSRTQPHVAGLDPRDHRAYKALGGWHSEGALAGRAEVGRGDVVDLDAVRAFTWLPADEQQELAKEAGLTPAAITEAIGSALAAMRLQ